MALIIGVDLGTTKTTSIAVETDSGEIVASASAASGGRLQRQEHPGRSEWDANQIIDCGLLSLKELSDALADRSKLVAGIGITGQQHGTVIVDAERNPLTPFINWQDQRGNELAYNGRTWVDLGRQRLGEDLLSRTGCRLNTGFLATTLFWLTENAGIPDRGTACFIADLLAARLTDTAPVTEPTNAGGAGVFDVADRQWSREAVDALGLDIEMLPPIVEADEAVGSLSSEVAEQIGLPCGLPVFPAIGDHQASYVGSVADRHSSILLNIGTGAQVAVFTTGNEYRSPIELRPFPYSGNLLSNVGLAGGWQYQVLETLIRQIGVEVFGVDTNQPLYDQITKLAGEAEAGSGGLSCTPTFSGTRANPEQTGRLSGMTPQNLSPGNLIRSVLEGMAVGYRDAYDQIAAITGDRHKYLVGAGNGLRQNAVLNATVAESFGRTPFVARHREEAAFGAALIGAVGSGLFADLDEAGRLIHYSE